ncbi:MAG: RdgB/HAM1 family non-canonical purine NTP pyrophosphatase [Phycisphaerae bacterium]|jgi:XTP/dITP diphosphohydrolase|nr:RdgB/HAM1 family non-canonical purine NTP pyrophosphatase [Phycisphaerae bacterium]
MPQREIVLATGNPGKLREIAQVLAGLPVDVVALNELADIPEPDETGETFARNARDKALYYSRATGRWCLADDSGLEVDALDGAPGVRSARYSSDTVAPGSDRSVIDRANNSKLLAALDSIPDPQRTARFVCCLALASPGEILIETSGTFEGLIARGSAGDNGFGYDPLFYVPDHGCTAAQLPPEEKNRISHRGQAVRRFAELLTDYLARED